MTYEQALHRLDNWYENNCVEISPELLDCCHDALQKVIPMTWRNVKKDGLPPDTERWKEYNVCVLRQNWPTSSFDPCDAPYSEEIITSARFDARQKIWHLSWDQQLNALIDPEDLSNENSDCVTDWMPLPKKPGEK